jgi:hypothetical protein
LLTCSFFGLGTLGGSALNVVITAGRVFALDLDLDARLLKGALVAELLLLRKNGAALLEVTRVFEHLGVETTELGIVACRFMRLQGVCMSSVCAAIGCARARDTAPFTLGRMRGPCGISDKALQAADRLVGTRTRPMRAHEGVCVEIGETD